MITVGAPVPLVLFSGGLDSTFLLWKLLDHTDVEVLYVDGPQGDIKGVIEKNARVAIIDWLHKCKPFKVRKQIVTSSFSNTGVAGGLNGQALAWFAAAISTAEPVYHSEVNIAYVMGDRINIFLDRIQAAWDLMLPVFRDQHIPLKFPLTGLLKQDIMETMPLELYKLTWICHTPQLVANTGKYVACGECDACIIRTTQELFFKLRTKVDYLNPPAKPVGFRFSENRPCGHSPGDTSWCPECRKEGKG